MQGPSVQEVYEALVREFKNTKLSISLVFEWCNLFLGDIHLNLRLQGEATLPLVAGKPDYGPAGSEGLPADFYDSYSLLASDGQTEWLPSVKFGEWGMQGTSLWNDRLYVQPTPSHDDPTARLYYWRWHPPLDPSVSPTTQRLEIPPLFAGLPTLYSMAAHQEHTDQPDEARTYRALYERGKGLLDAARKRQVERYTRRQLRKPPRFV